jgi:LPS sulfotransferase NodH
VPEPVSSYLVCATQCSGSTLLCELLKGTGVAGCPEEFFEAVRDTSENTTVNSVAAAAIDALGGGIPEPFFMSVGFRG